MKERFMTFDINAIGFVKSPHKNKYEAFRQGVEHKNIAEIILEENQNYETALLDLDGFEYIWLIFLFHHNKNWKPKVLPPRQPRLKRGVFATRAPYRPNPIGISAVKLLEIKKRKLIIANHDLLDETPIIDIKPYIPYADSFPDAKTGWLETISDKKYEIHFSNDTKDKFNWLETKRVHFLAEVKKTLTEDPYPHPYKRIKKFEEHYEYYFQKWLCKYQVENDSSINIIDLSTVLSKDRAISEDEKVHVQFLEQFN